MLAVILGVVNAFVVANAVPKVGVLNHAMVAPAGGVADKTTVPVPHLEPGVTEGAAGAVVTDTDDSGVVKLLPVVMQVMVHL